MNETIRPPPALASNVPWPTSDDRVRVPDTSMLPGSNPAPPPVVTLLNDAAQRAAAGGDALHSGTGRLRETRDEWVEGVRTTVRGNPLACIAAAAALGAVIARITR